MTSPWRSCVSVVTPSTNVPTYSLSSLMSKSWTFVPRPTVIKSRPVAMGSSVPQWPTFLISSLRRTRATTSCEVIPSALSTSRTPSGVAVNDVTNRLQNALLYFTQSTTNPGAGCECMSAAAKFLADGANIHRFTLGPHAHADFAVSEFFKKNRHDDPANGANMIDQSFIILRQDAEVGGNFDAKTETGDASIAFEAHGAK